MKTVLVLLLVLVICFAVMWACDIPLFFASFENGGHYTAGDCQIYDNVREIEIDWLSGEVTVQYHKENYISVTEEASGSLSKNDHLHYRLEGDTLHIQYSGRRWRQPKSKSLIVSLPGNTILEELSIDTVSADICLEEISSEEVSLETVSGNIMADETHVSGEFDADSVSGDVTLCLPSDTPFSVHFSTVSGRFHSDIPYSKSGKRYTCGTGGQKYDIETVSGNVSILTDN